MLIPFTIPDKYYLPAPAPSLRSSTVGAFSAKAALKGAQGFQGRLLPTSRDDLRPKKTLVINYFPEHIDFYQVIGHLLNEGFKILVMDTGIPVQITFENIREVSDYDFGLDQSLMVKDLVTFYSTTESPLRSDHILVCDYQEMSELRDCFIPDHVEADNEVIFTNWVIEQWVKTCKMPKGADYPCLSLSKKLVDALGVEGFDALSESGLGVSWWTGDIKHLLASDHAVLSGDLLVSIGKVVKQITHFDQIGNSISDLSEVDIRPEQIERIYINQHEKKLSRKNYDSIRSTSTLKHLSLYNIVLSDDFEIKHLKKIETLVLQKVELSYKLLREILESTSITELTLVEVKIIGDNTEPVRTPECPHLKNLQMMDGSSKLLEILLPGMKNIETLSLSYVNFHDDFRNSVMHLPNLKKLEVIDSDIGEELCIKLLSLSSQIQILKLELSASLKSGSDPDWSAVSLENLKVFTWNVASHWDRFCCELLDLTKNLEAIIASGSGMRLPILKKITNGRYDFKVIHLDTISCEFNLDKLLKSAKNLRSLKLKIGESNFSDLSMLECSKLEKLETLELSDLYLTGGIHPRVFKRSLRKLLSVKLSGCAWLTAPSEQVRDDHNRLLHLVLKKSRYSQADDLANMLNPLIKLEQHLIDPPQNGSNDNYLLASDVRCLYFSLANFTSAQINEWVARCEAFVIESMKNLSIECAESSYTPIQLRNPADFESLTEFELKLPQHDQVTAHNFTSRMPVLRKQRFEFPPETPLKQERQHTFTNQYTLASQNITNSSNTASSSSETAGVPVLRDVVTGEKVAGQVYDGEPGVDSGSTLKNLIAGSGQHALKPMFELVSGPDLKIEHTRNRVYKPAYDDLKHIMTHEIEPDFIEFKGYYKPKKNELIYKRHEYTAKINPPQGKINQPWIKLVGLKAHDRLVSVSIHGLRYGIDYVIAPSSSNGFFYLLFNNNTSHQQEVVLSYELAPKEKICHHYPEPMQKLIEPFKRPPLGKQPPEFVDLSLAKQLAAVLEHPEFHPCSVRTDAFLSRMAIMVSQGVIEDYRAADSSFHAWAEIKYQGVWYTLDLGGTAATIEYQPLPQTVVPSNKRIKLTTTTTTTTSATSTATQPKNDPVANTVESDKALVNLLKIEKPNNNILFVCKSNTQAELLIRLIMGLDPQSTTKIEGAAHLDSTSRYLSVDFDKSSWMPVNPLGTGGWLKNRLTQTKRIIFNWGRFTTSESIGFNTAIDQDNRSIDGVPLDPAIQGVGVITENHPLMKDESFIRRYRDNTWTVNFNPIFRENALNHLDEPLVIDLYHSNDWEGILLGRLGYAKGEPAYLGSEFMAQQPSLLILKHPPTSCKEFENFVESLQQGYEWKYYDKSIPLRKTRVQVERGKAFRLDSKKIGAIYQNISFEDLKHIEIDQVLNPSTFERCIELNTVSEGRLSQEKGWLAMGAQTFFITQQLSDEQYVYLCNHAQKPPILYFAKGLSVPALLSEYKASEYHNPPISSYSQKADITSDPIIIDISEFGPDELLYGFEYELTDQNRFVFKETVSELWLALKAGKHVVLKGIFTNELIEHLSTLLLPQGYLWHDGKKEYHNGKLSLMPKYPMESLRWCESAVLPYQEKSKPETKIRVIAEHEQQRVPTVLELLKTERFLFIEGEPGAGKSFFIRQLKSHEQLKVFTYNSSNSQGLLDWAQSSDPRMNILIIDEATIRGTDWSIFNGTHLIVHGKMFALSPDKKILFVGNRVKPMPALLDEDFPTVVFPKPSDECILNEIIKPIFAQIHQEYNAEAFFNENKSSMSLRALQDKALSECARIKYKADQLQLNSSSYVLTASRLPVFKSLINILLVRHFKQEAPVNAEPARFGGQPGCWLVGAPGIGKTEIIRSTLSSMNYQEKTVDDMYKDTTVALLNSAYRVPASCNIESLRRHAAFAFKHGLVLWIDELDSLIDPDRSSPDEVARFLAELNSYLMGEDLDNNRAQVPGFILLATGNGIQLGGRAPIPKALESRLNKHEMEAYTPAEQAIIDTSKARSTAAPLRFSNTTAPVLPQVRLSGQNAACTMQ